MRRLLENFLRIQINYLHLMRTNVVNELITSSVNESVHFIKELSKNQKFELFSSRTKIQEYFVDLLEKQNRDNLENLLLLEFGTFKGASLRYFCRNLPEYRCVGFDTFLGLSESFGGVDSATFFNRRGKIPRYLPKNSHIIVGDCTETIKNYLKDINGQKIAGVHFDLDVYVATRVVMEELKPYLNSGTYILFDELLGNPFWQEGEFAALNEVYSPEEFKWLAFGPNQALIQLK